MGGLCEEGYQYSIVRLHMSNSLWILSSCLLCAGWLFLCPITPSFFSSCGKCRVIICVPLPISLMVPWWWLLIRLSWKPYVLGLDYSWLHLLGTIPHAHLLWVLIKPWWILASYQRGGRNTPWTRFSKVSKKFWFSESHWQQNLKPDIYRAIFVPVSLIRTEVLFYIQDISGAYTPPFLDTDELKMALRAWKVFKAFKKQASGHFMLWKLEISPDQIGHPAYHKQLNT